MTLNEILKNAGKELKDITTIYRGKNHHCRCGCGGVYHDPGSRGFKLATNKMNKSDFRCFDVEYDSTYINIPYDYDNDLCYCIYFD